MTTKPQAEPVPSPMPADDEPKIEGRGAKRRAGRMTRRRQKAEQAQEKREASAASVLSEGFSGRELRNAVRLARRSGVDASDPFEAVRLLRAKGIDPAQPANPLYLVVDNTRPKPDAARIAPVPLPGGKSPAQIADEQKQALEVHRVQQEISRRRRRNLNRLFLRLTLWVLIPTFGALLYFWQVATPMYATSAEFIVQKSNGGSGGLSSLFSGTSLGSAQEAVAVQSYLQSKEAMVRLNAEHGFAAHFAAPEIDPLSRLALEASIEQAYRVYQRRVSVGYDPTEGVIKLRVQAAEPDKAVEFAGALVAYAEQVVNDLTLRQRKDQLTGAERSFAEAEADMQEAERQVVAMQEERGVVSAEAEVGALMAQIATLEMQEQEASLRLASLRDNLQPNPARLSAAERDVARLQQTIAEERAQLTAKRADGRSLARVTSELHIAEAALATRQTLFQEALKQLQTARREADRQVGYLALNVAPVRPQEAAYPRVAANTAMAFLIFAGIYLMVSLTASVLREQVSS